MTIGRHSIFMPVNIAYIASYALAHISDLEIRLYDNVEKIIKDIDEWSPDIVGLSNYCWNTDLSSLVFRYAKKNNPNILTVAGGPDFPGETKKCEDYLLNKKEIDFYVYREGEIAFVNLVRLFLEIRNISSLKNECPDGTMSIGASQDIIVGKEISRIVDLDIIPSPYLNHLLDDWFDGSCAPSIETTRGCPFTCQYCRAANSCYNRIGQFSHYRIETELSYIAEKMQNYPGILLSICDTNFGIYKKDKEIINHIEKLQQKYNWPIDFDVTTGKAKYNEILDMIIQLGGSMRFYCAVQSLNPATLSFIKRKNISLDKYARNLERANENNVISVADLILPLPEETKETFLNGLENVMNSGIVYVYPFTTMMLMGTGLATDANREKYDMKTKFRIIPRMFGEYLGEKCFEVEEVCVATNTMSFDEYLECRGIILVASLLGSDQVDIIPLFLEELGISNFDFIYSVWSSIVVGDDVISQIYHEYISETISELWDSKEDIYDFYSQSENYNKLLKGEYGDNLLRKYKIKIILEHYKDLLDSFFTVIKILAKDRITEDMNDFLDDSNRWLFTVRRVDNLLRGEIDDRVEEINLLYDINKWYSSKSKNMSLSSYKHPVKYRIFYQDIEVLLQQIIQREKLFGKDCNYNIGKIMMDSNFDPFWRDCV